MKDFLRSARLVWALIWISATVLMLAFSPAHPVYTLVAPTLAWAALYVPVWVPLRIGMSWQGAMVTIGAALNNRDSFGFIFVLGPAGLVAALVIGGLIALVFRGRS